MPTFKDTAFKDTNSTIYVTWYKPSEWLYLLTSKVPEWNWLYNTLDHVRWILERLEDKIWKE